MRIFGIRHYLSYIFIVLTVLIIPFSASLAAESCAVDDRTCVLSEIQKTAANIENKSWRDQIYRELAKTKAFEGDTSGAIAVIDLIETPDTQAMTIRGIGMAAADIDLNDEEYDALFTALRAKAETITHPPSYAIALTYIAMAQAFAGDNDGAWKTASDMENDALRHKAYGETAEIQAEKGDFESAMKSIAYIDSDAFKNKAYSIVSKILAGKGQYKEALHSAMQITNAYKKSQALQTVLDAQKPRDK